MAPQSETMGRENEEEGRWRSKDRAMRMADKKGKQESTASVIS